MTRDDWADLGDDLYREYILDHYRSPRHAGKLSPADVAEHGDNPLCGDEVDITATLAEDGSLKELRFQATGCAISQASADILAGEVQGRTQEEIQRLDRTDVEGWLGITLRPARVKCATLSLHTLKAGLRKARQSSTGDGRVPGF